MGYTHYWHRTKTIDAKTFKAIVEDFKKFLPLFKVLDVQLADGNGEGEPEITEDRVCFNGKRACGHKTNKNVVIPWPSDQPKGNVAVNSNNAIAGSWFVGVRLNQRTCNGTCDYETFSFPRIIEETNAHPQTEGEMKGLYFDFTKTAYRPYDLVVNVFLIIAKHFLGKRLIVYSDGTIMQWLDAVKLCENVLHYGQEFTLP